MDQSSDKNKQRVMPFKRKGFTLAQKLKILEEYDNSDMTMGDISRKYGISGPNFRNWKARQAEWIQRNQPNKRSKNYKKFRQLKRFKPLIDSDNFYETMYIWFDLCSRMGIYVTASMVTEKAVELHSQMQIKKPFTGSHCWINLRKKYWLRLITKPQLKPEKLLEDATRESILFNINFNNYVENEKLELSQIFYVNKMVLFYKLKPDKTAKEKSISVLSGEKKFNNRLTILLCSNANGTFKLPPLIIGKPVEPKGLKNIESLQMNYAHQKSAWITASIFKDWFENNFAQNVKKFLSRNNLPEKAVLLTTPTPWWNGMLNNLEVDGMSVLYLPEHRFVPPLISNDIFRNFQTRYKLRLSQSLIDAQNDHVSLDYYLDGLIIKDVIHWIRDSWDGVSAECILWSWKDLLPKHHFANIKVDLSECSVTEHIISCFRHLKDYKDVDIQYIKDWILLSDADLYDELVKVKIGDLIVDETDEEVSSDEEEIVTPEFIAIKVENFVMEKEEQKEEKVSVETREPEAQSKESDKGEVAKKKLEDIENKIKERVEEEKVEKEKMEENKVQEKVEEKVVEEEKVKEEVEQERVEEKIKVEECIIEDNFIESNDVVLNENEFPAVQNSNHPADIEFIDIKTQSIEEEVENVVEEQDALQLLDRLELAKNAISAADTLIAFCKDVDFGGEPVLQLITNIQAAALRFIQYKRVTV